MPIHRADGSVQEGTGGLTQTTLPGSVIQVGVGPAGPIGPRGLEGPPGPPGRDGEATLPFANDANAVLRRIGSEAPFFAPLTLDQVLAAFAVTLSGGSTLELGQTRTNPSFNATYNRVPELALFSINNGYSLDVTLNPNSFSTVTSMVRYSVGQSYVATLSASEAGGPTKTATTTFLWYPRSFYGIGAAGQSSEAFIEALASSVLTGTRAGSFTVTAGPGEKIYYGYPVIFGLATFTVGGFEGGYMPPTTVLGITNPFGVTLDYYLYESTNANLGLTTTLVS